MLDSLNKTVTNVTPVTAPPAVSSTVPSPTLIPPGFDMLDELTKPKKRKRGGKGKKGRKGKKSRTVKTYSAEYVQLAYSYGVVCSRYDFLEQIVKLSMAANRGRLNDELLDNGLIVLERTQTKSLPR